MSTRFHDALHEAALPLIMEVKPRSADGVDLLGGRTLSEIVNAYEQAQAPCISVVTGKWFGGTPQLVADVRSRTDLPILRKDFITRRSQLEQTVELGGDAVLLTAQLLPSEALLRLAREALECGLTPFIEVVSAKEIAAVRHVAQQSIVAVNNKDIRTQEREAADLDRSRRLLSAVLETGCALPVSASGIDTPEDARKVLSWGYRGLLVGTALLDAVQLDVWSDIGSIRAGNGIHD